MKKTPSPEIYTKEYFLQYCGRYEEFRHGDTFRKFARALDFLGPTRGEPILDVGCGRGEMVAQLGQHGALAFGVDYSGAAVRLAKNHVGKHAHIVWGSGTALPFPDGCFRKIVMLDFLEHLDRGDQRRCLSEVRRVLHESGLVVVYGCNGWAAPLQPLYHRLVGFKMKPEPLEYSCEYQHVGLLSPLSVRKSLHRAGFDVKVLFDEFHVPQDASLLSRIGVQAARHIVPFLGGMWCLARPRRLST